MGDRADLKLRDAKDVAGDIQGCGRLRRGEVLVLEQRLLVLDWALSVPRDEIIRERNRIARDWAKADEKDGEELALMYQELALMYQELEEENAPKTSPGRPKGKKPAASRKP